MPQRIALLGIYHESNTFVAAPTTLSDFKNGHLLKGEDIRKEYASAHHEIGGMMEVMDHEGFEVIPVMYAEATPGGVISSETYRVLLKEMMEELEKMLPVDGCLVVPHGAAVSEIYPDMDGHWLSVLRNKVGPAIPIVGTLDPHANVSRLMVTSTNTLVAYKTNPHVDQRQTGRDAAALLVKMLQQKIRPLQYLTGLQLAISIEKQHTGSDPCKSLYAFADELRRYNDILSVSIILGFPYADVHEMGSAVIVVSDNNAGAASFVSTQLAAYTWENRQSFAGNKEEVSVSLESVQWSRKPVLMLDMGDNIGGGSSGNSTFLLDELERKDRYKSFICICDPRAVGQAARCRAGEKFRIRIKNHDEEIRHYDVTLLRVADGRFTETTPRHGGQVNFDMGRIAIVSTTKGNVIMLTTLRVSPFSLKQLTSFNIEPENFDIIVAKGVNAPIAAYAPVCPTIIQVNTPGVTQADMTLFNYKNRRRPMYPFETTPAFKL